MSSMRFHTENADVSTVQGAERTHGLSLAIETAMRVLGADSAAAVNSLIRRGVLPRDATEYTAFGKTPLEALRMWLVDPLGLAEVKIGGQSSPVTHAMLNSAAVEGPDPVAFLARLHGSVENRIWVDADHVAWFTSVLAEGRVSGILRAGMGWEDVIDRLGAADGPVVVSSSQGAGFPDDLDDDQAVPATAWRDSLSRLQQQGWWLQLTPGNLRQPAYAPLKTFQELLTSA